jgi:hypothetical protein
LLFFAEPVIFKQRKKYVLMGTYEIPTNFGVCNKSEDENNFMKNERRNFNVYLGIFVIVSDSTEIGIV